MMLRKKKTETGISQIIDNLNGVVPRSLRSHRKMDLDKPFEIRLVSLQSLRDPTIKIGLARMFDGYFSICDFDKLCRLAKVYPPSGLKETLSVIHCVDWIDMEPEYRENIQAHIVACFVPIEQTPEQTLTTVRTTQ